MINPFNMNPQQILQNIMSNSSIMQNPIAKNAVELYQKGDSKAVNEMAQNMCKERGVDANQFINQLISQFK